MPGAGPWVYAFDAFSVNEVEAEGEVGRWAEGLEFGRCVAGGAEGLRIHAGVLRPENPDVPDRGRHGHVPRAEEPAREVLGGAVRQRHLAEPPEITFLEEARDRTARVFAHHDR